MAEVTDKTPRVRSPAYPTLGLPEAIEKARILYTKEGQGRHPIPAVSVAKDWEYASLNGSALTAISALKQFGILEELDVDGDKPRQLKITAQGLSLIVRPRESDEWIAAVRAAALQPKLYLRLWNSYGWPLPSDDTLKSYLELDEGYNIKFIDSIIKDFKASILFAKLVEPDKIDDNEASVSPKIGDYIQWERQGKDEFPSPKRVTNVDKSWVYVEGLALPVRFDQVRIEQPPPVGMPPGRQVVHAPAPPLSMGQKDFPLHLFDGKRGMLFIPDSITSKDYDILKRQIEHHLMVIKETIVSKDEPPK